MEKKKKLHPSVQKFKEFVALNPQIAKEVKSGNATWQDLFEEWYLLGEEDTRWDAYRGERKEQPVVENKKDWMSQVMGAIKNLDPDQVQGQISNLSQAISAVQSVLTQFQGKGSGGAPGQMKNSPQHPFSFRKD
ncbi:YlbD family protein [Mesobacillus zeae]|uniref:Cytosolic protein n=1 Tax=Mesobacillus zeae TaxID=1917180 RepID=A0A398BGT4_9BACI|nr:YlbD family protein [Mesobacillus zeae]RID87878.1 hypothetical protein D1970_03315 [Mesobacillus zeae]